MWLTQSLRGLAPFIAQDLFIGAVVGGLFVWALISGTMLYLKARTVRRQLNRARLLLERTSDSVTFATTYESTSADLAREPLIGPCWRGFRQSLLIPATTGRPVAATTDARQWFDLADLFRRAGADLRYHAALPGLLVGAGLLVTFLGLAAALSAAGAVVAEGVDQAQRNAALRDLLGAASVKFVTSLAGLFLSIVYALVRKDQLRRTETAFAEFIGALQERVPLRTPAALQADANALLEKQYAELQQIGTDFFVNLGSTLEREFDQGLQQHLGPLAVAIEKLSVGLANHNERAIESMLGTFLERLEGAVGESMRSTTAALGEFGTRLGALQAGLEEAAQRMGNAAEEMAGGIVRGGQAALGGLTEQMGGLVRVLREAADEAARSNRAAGDELARQMQETAAGLAQAVALFQERVEAGAAKGIEQIGAPIRDMLDQLRQLAEQQRAAGAQASEELAATIGRAAGALEVTATKIGETLGGGAADASGRLVAATEAMRDSLRGVLDRFGETIGRSGDMLTQGAVAGGKTMSDAAAALGAELAAAAACLREAGEAAGDALREGGAEARAGMTQSAETLARSSAGLADRSAALGTAAASLGERTTAFGQAVQAIATPLTASAADLRAAGEAARDAARPLQEVARAASGSLDGMAAATAAIGAVQREIEQLAARLGGAADRFEGLDKALAGTLQVVVSALADYQTRMIAFVNGIDTGLGRNVSALTAVATQLESAVEDLGDRLPPTINLPGAP